MLHLEPEACFLLLQKPRKKKDKKAKKEKEKKEKKEKRKKNKEKRSEYIEPEGITTPSKENLPPSQQPTPMEVKLPVSVISHSPPFRVLHAVIPLCPVQGHWKYTHWT